MVFDAGFPVGQGTHFVPGFGEKAVVFWAAFSDAWFAAAGTMWVGIPGDGQEHFINHRRDCSGFVFGPGGGIGELAHGIQAAFEGEPVEIDIVGEGGFLHDAADEVVGDEMHSQLAFDHVWREAPQHVHVEVDFDFAEVEFDAPSPEVEIGEVCGRDGGIEQSGHERHALGAKPLVGDGVAHDAHGDALGQKSEFLRCLCGGALRRAFPGHHHIEVF